MALLPTTQTAAAAATGKQIFVNTYNASNAVVYTVPAGKTFVGYFQPGGQYASIQVNGVSLSPAASSYYSIAPIPLTLVSGTAVSGNASYSGCLYGVEQ